MEDETRKGINLLLIVMGTTGSGKSTVAETLAKSLNAPFIEGDDFHSQENKTKMASGIPLQDSDRWPWLGKIKAKVIETFSSLSFVSEPQANFSGTKYQNKASFIVLACSSLKKSYRDYLLNDPSKGTRSDQDGTYYSLILYLKGSYDVILERLKARKNHFAGPALLDSQFSVLEEPSPEKESVVEIPLIKSVSDIDNICFDAVMKHASLLLTKCQRECS